MARLRDSVAASYAGQAWVAVMGIIFIPAYLRALGAEAFGLVAFMFGLQAVSLVLDLGVSTYLGRELAQRAHDPARRGGLRRLVRTFEWLAWPMALLIAAVLWMASEPIAVHWLNASTLDPGITTRAMMLVALAVAMSWPTTLYNACLTGLEQQPRLNAVLAVFATLRYAGVLPVLYLTESGVLGFVAWHALVAGVQALCTAWLLWRHLPAADRPRGFEFSELVQARDFALGVFAITGLAIVITQLDRMSLSLLRPLEELGLYAVVLSVSAGLARLMQPIFNAVYPRLSQLAGSGHLAQLSETYHLSSQLATAVAAAVAAVIGLHSRSVLWLWTGDPELADRLALPLALLMAGTALSGMQCIPYALQLASGWVRLAAWGNLVTALLALPLYYFAVSRYGMVGAAASWLAVNVGYLAVSLPWMHRRLLPGELGQWLWRGSLPPILAAVGVGLAARWIGHEPSRDASGAAWLVLLSAATLAAALIAAPAVRGYALNWRDHRPWRGR